MDGYNFIGIGKIILSHDDNVSYNIPHLHFIISKSEDGVIEAISLEFSLVASGDTSERAVQHLAEMLVEYTKRTVATLSFDKLIEAVNNSYMDAFWREYRVMEFTLAKTKQDIGNAVIEQITKRITKEIMEKYGITSEIRYSVVEEKAA